MNTLHLDDTQIRLRELVEICHCLAQKYNVVVTNPPYMGKQRNERKTVKLCEEELSR